MPESGNSIRFISSRPSPRAPSLALSSPGTLDRPVLCLLNSSTCPVVCYTSFYSKYADRIVQSFSMVSRPFPVSIHGDPWLTDVSFHGRTVFHCTVSRCVDSRSLVFRCTVSSGDSRSRMAVPPAEGTPMNFVIQLVSHDCVTAWSPLSHHVTISARRQRMTCQRASKSASQQSVRR